jgi:PPIC-type PPIASE domain
MFSAWWREPLVHFLAIGALLFFLFEWRGSGPASRRIVITPGQVDSLAAGFARTWQRSPTDEELKGLIDEYVREEIATREAIAAGLDRDDTIIRRRLRQKMEFLAEDTIDTSPPTDVELRTWLEAHPDVYRPESEVAFRQVMLSPDRRGEALDQDARAMLAQLSTAGGDARIDALGDARLLPSEVDRAPRSDVVRLFGEAFADELLRAQPGRWVGPIGSGYGVHLVFVRERREGQMPSLDDVRQQVERDFMVERRRRELEATYERHLDRYQVVIERRASGPQTVPSPESRPQGESQ